MRLGNSVLKATMLAALSLCPALAVTSLRVELGGSTGEVATSETEKVSTSISTPHGVHDGSADFGSVTASSAISISTTAGDPGLNAISTFSDDIVITSPGIVAFARGTLVATVTFEGSLSVVPSELSAGDGASGGALYRMNLFYNENPDSGFNGIPAISEEGRLSYDRLFSEEVTSTGTVPPTTSFEVEIPIKFGIPIQIRLEVLAAAFASLTDLAPEGASIQTSSDFKVGARWESVKELRNAADVVLENFAIETASGINWIGVAPPPEPVYFSDFESSLSERNDFDQQFLQLSITRVSPVSGLGYRLEASENLFDWFEFDPVSSERLVEIISVESIETGLERIVIQDTRPALSELSARYIRMVALPPES